MIFDAQEESLVGGISLFLRAYARQRVTVGRCANTGIEIKRAHCRWR